MRAGMPTSGAGGGAHAAQGDFHGVLVGCQPQELEALHHRDAAVQQVPHLRNGSTVFSVSVTNPSFPMQRPWKGTPKTCSPASAGRPAPR